MDQLMAYAQAHFIAIAIGWYLFSAFVSCLPDPTSSSSPLYVAVNKFLHLVAGNLADVAAVVKLPTAKVGMILLCLLLPLTLLTSCTPQAIALLDAVVTSIEVAMPTIPNLPAGEATSVNAYLNAMLGITHDMTENASTPDKLVALANDLGGLAAPRVSDPQMANFLKAIEQAAKNVVAAYAAPVPTHVATFGAKKTKVKALPKLEELKKRIEAAKAKISK